MLNWAAGWNWAAGAGVAAAGGEHRKLLCRTDIVCVRLSRLGVLLSATIYCHTLLLPKNQAESWLLVRFALAVKYCQMRNVMSCRHFFQYFLVIF